MRTTPHHALPRLSLALMQGSDWCGYLLGRHEAITQLKGISHSPGRGALLRRRVLASSGNIDTAMSASPGPVWKGDKCTSRYVWENAPLPSHSPSFGSGKQAVNITLMRKRDPKRAAPKGLYVCKWYRTSGVKQTSVGGPKFIHREWTILSSVHHPNIVAYEDFSYDPNGARLAKLYLEYCPRGDLSRHLKGNSRDDRLEYHEGLQVLEQLTQALLYIHHGVSRNGSSTELASVVSAGLQPTGEDDPTKWATILHRDIKPANGKAPSTLCRSRLTILIVFIAEHNTTGIEVKLGDFGVARFETDGTDTYVGSKNFMAPVRPGSTIKHCLCADICFRSNELQTMTADGPPPKVTYMP
jgi:hypothetical protein